MMPTPPLDSNELAWAPASPRVGVPASALWRRGWYRYARHELSPNFGPRPFGAEVDLLVLHCISLPPGCYQGEAVQQLFTNALDWDSHPYYDSIRGLQVSAHFFIRRSGELWQFVSCCDRAWHAGASRYRGRDNCNDDSVGIELEGTEGEAFEPAQYESLASVCAALPELFPLRHVAGHEHIAPGRKADPGSGFAWHALQRSLALPRNYFPAAAAQPPVFAAES